MPYKAVPFLRKALENCPGDPAADGKTMAETRALLGTAYLKSKHSQAAVQMLEEAVNDAPADKRIYRAYLNSLLVRGIRLCGIEDYDLGLQMLRFVMQNGPEAGIPDSPFLRLQLGRAARENGQPEEALEHFTAALKLTGADDGKRGGAGKSGKRAGGSGDRRIRWSRASILMALGRNTEARKEIEKIRSRDAGVPELPWNSEMVDLFMIRSFLEAGEWKQAAESCRHWLKRAGKAGEENMAMVHALYAEALRNTHDFKSAHNHLLRALEISPRELEFWYADILVSWEGRDYKSLKKALRTAESLGGDPDIIGRFTILCKARTQEDSFGNITLLQNAIRKLGPEPELMYALGDSYLRVGLIDEALSWFKKTLILKKDHESAWLGEIAALEALQKADQEQPVGRRPEARAESGQDNLGGVYKAYLEQWPDNSSIRREYALYLIKIFEYEDSGKELEKLLVWEPSNSSLRRVLAYTYRKTGRYREAAVFLKSLLREKPKDIGLLIEYSGCLERAGAPGYATAVLEKARELFESTSWKTRGAKNKVKSSGGTSAIAAAIAADNNAANSAAGTSAGVADIYLALGILSFRQKNVEKSFDYLREAAALATGDPRPYEWMAIIARENGDAGDGKYYEKEAQKRKKRKN